MTTPTSVPSKTVNHSIVIEAFLWVPISSFNKDDQRLFKKTTTHFERNEHAAFGEYSRINFDKRLDSECLSLSDLTNGNHGCDSDNEEEDYFGGEEYYGEGELFGEGEGEDCEYS